MTEVLTILFFNSLLCLGVFYSTKQGYILSFFSEWYDVLANRSKIFMWLRKPLFGCVSCTASFWGLIGIVALHPFELFSHYTILYIFALSALNLILSSIIAIGGSISNLNEFITSGR